MPLKMFFKSCQCGQNLRFDHTEQKRICPSCKKEITLSSEMKIYLLKKKVEEEKGN